MEEKLNMKFKLMAAVIGLSFVATAAETPERIARIQEAGKVFQEIMATEDKAIPKELLEEARCMAIVPGLKKAGFVVGGNYGKGVMVCRVAGTNRWSAPSTVKIEGGSVGAQIGGGEVDVVLMVMNDRGAEKLMGSEFTIGGEVAAMAGPIGRQSSAKTDASLRSGILSYSRARGLFAGIALNGSTLRADDEDNAEIYGKKVEHRDILMGRVPPPAAASSLYAAIGAGIGGANGGTRSRTNKR
jgi:SH3 domain-containing YSC84-like protein 1